MDYTTYLVYCGSMLKIALTGNIASGKSLVQKIYENGGYSVLDLDEAVNYIYLNNENFKNGLISLFNTDKKSEIAKIVFEDKKNLCALEKLIAPEIERALQDYFIKNQDKKLVIVAAPMLFEYRFEKYFDKIIFVSSNPALRLERLIKRNDYTKEYALLRINSQNDEEEKIKKSDFVVYNNGTLEDLEKAAREALEFLL